jgi:hypothetical protein
MWFGLALGDVQPRRRWLGVSRLKGISIGIRENGGPGGEDTRKSGNQSVDHWQCDAHVTGLTRSRPYTPGAGWAVPYWKGRF